MLYMSFWYLACFWHCSMLLLKEYDSTFHKFKSLKGLRLGRKGEQLKHRRFFRVGRLFCIKL